MPRVSLNSDDEALVQVEHPARLIKDGYPDDCVRLFGAFRDESFNRPGYMPFEADSRRDENLGVYAKFLGPFEVVTFDDKAAIHHARIRACLGTSESTVGPNDMAIAATVPANSGTLFSHDVKKFKQIPGLQLEDWVAENRAESEYARMTRGAC